jgi:hypothetical protein
MEAFSAILEDFQKTSRRLDILRQTRFSECFGDVRLVLRQKLPIGEQLIQRDSGRSSEWTLQSYMLGRGGGKVGKGEKRGGRIRSLQHSLSERWDRMKCYVALPTVYLGKSCDRAKYVERL